MIKQEEFFSLIKGWENQRNSDAFFTHLKQGQSPISGKVTSILLALKLV
jgi:hypothetical protein